MELRTTKEDMIERFKLCGEILCLCARLTEDDTLEDFNILWEDIQEELDLPEDKELIVDIDEQDKQVPFIGISYDFYDVLHIDYQSKYSNTINAIWCNTTTLDTIKCYIERYCKSLKDESK